MIDTGDIVQPEMRIAEVGAAEKLCTGIDPESDGAGIGITFPQDVAALIDVKADGILEHFRQFPFRGRRHGTAPHMTACQAVGPGVIDQTESHGVIHHHNIGVMAVAAFDMESHISGETGDHGFAVEVVYDQFVSEFIIPVHFEKLIDLGWVTRIRDMFDLSRFESEWKNLPGFGEKSVSNILRAIETCRNCDLESAIAAIGIPLIGRTVAKDLARRFTSYGAFKENIKGDFDFSSLGGYGYEMNKSLKTFDYTELDYIVENYLNIKEEKQEEKKQKLKDLTFCVTGKVKIFKNRDELSAFIESLGGKVTGSVTKNTDYLINNDTESTSAKNKKAKELNIKIIGEQAFMDLFDIEK